MANTFQLEILASDRPFYVGPAEQLVFPTVDGLMGILPGHESMVTVVSPGELKYLVDGQWHYAAISDVPLRLRSVPRSVCSTSRASCSIITARLR